MPRCPYLLLGFRRTEALWVAWGRCSLNAVVSFLAVQCQRWTRPGIKLGRRSHSLLEIIAREVKKREIKWLIGDVS